MQKIDQKMLKYIETIHLVIHVFHQLFLSNMNSCVEWILLHKFSPNLVDLRIVVYVVYYISEFHWSGFCEIT